MAYLIIAQKLKV